ncbi:hypothetical protein [Goodfellowiella coeruleoviolacea]|uniref:Uncharacterized protein n=1 Tax=Goodfellowiella coeruleoviolacea TaxID=334858 RepID=A0AAE3KP95_9PSEU|nr:hypothetical protein [Goodfellowiella coeruleoviolacea]MCP2169598.1 hypothetical protein [Goodfellowiella coeruleoviolacea]
MHGFTSYYWDVDDLSQEADQRAWTVVNKADDVGELLTAYQAMLHSDDVVARGIALDQYHYAQAQWRWGVHNPLAALEDDIAACAREVLATAPDPGAPDHDWPVVLAAWASALGALWHLGEDTDLPRILDVLDATVARGDEDGATDVLAGAFQAVRGCLESADEVTGRQAGQRLAALFTNENLPVSLRTSALGPFTAGQRTAAKLGQENALVALLHHPDLQLAGRAATALAGRDPHDALVREVVQTWPADADAASTVRRMIRAADNLAQARKTLAAVNSEPPPGPAELISAARELRNQGDPADLEPLMAAWNTDTTDTDLANAVSQALRRHLDDADDPTCHRIGARLAELASDETLPIEVRLAAIAPFFTGKLGHEDALVALLRHPDLRLSTQAAWVLVDVEQHVPLVREIAATWPADAPDPADRVRAELEND